MNLQFLFLLFGFDPQIIFFGKGIVFGNVHQEMCNPYIIFALLFIEVAVLIAGVSLVVDEFELLVDEISPFILPLSIGLLNMLHKYPWAILVVEIILLKSEHFIVVFSLLIPSFQILLFIAHVLNVLIQNINIGSFFFNDLVYLICVKICLRIEVFFEKH